MKHLYAILAASIISFSSSAWACAEPKWEWDNYRLTVESANPTVKYTELNKDEIKSVLGVINSIPPQTGYNYNRVGYFSLGDHQPVLLVLMMGDCVWEVKLVPPGGIKMLLDNGRGA